MNSHFILRERCGRHRIVCSWIYIYLYVLLTSHIIKFDSDLRQVDWFLGILWFSSPTNLTAEKKILLIMGRYTQELILFYGLLTIIVCKVSYPCCGLISVHLYPVTLHQLCLVDCKIHKFTEKGVYLRKQICNFCRTKIGIYDNDTNQSYLAKLMKEAKQFWAKCYFLLETPLVNAQAQIG